MIGFAARRVVPLCAAMMLTGTALAQGAEPEAPGRAPSPTTAEPDRAEAEAASPGAQPTDAATSAEQPATASDASAEPPAPTAAAPPPSAPTDRGAPATGTQPGPTARPWSPYGYPAGMAAPAPSATAPTPPPEAQEPEGPAPRTLPHWFTAELGVRAMLVTNDGFEPFTKSDVSLLGQLVVAGSITPLKFDPIAISIVPEYNVGARSGEVRGQESSLTLHRLAAGVRIDATITRHIHAYARVAPAAIYLHGSIRDAAIDRPLVSNAWTWGLDTTGGIAILMGAVGDREDPAVGFWLLAEYGYMFAGEQEMTYAPSEDEDDPRRFGSIDLPAIRPAGVVNRLAVALSF